MKNFFGGCLLSVFYLIIGLSIPVLIFLFFDRTTYWWMLFLEELPIEQLEAMDKYTTVIWGFCFIGIPAAVILLYRRSKKRRKEIIRRSDENNTFVTAYLVKSKRVYNRKSNTTNYRSTYEFTVNGEVKKYQILTGGYRPDEIRLYRKSENSNKFFSDIEPSWMIPLLILATILILFWAAVMLHIPASVIEMKR